jgi:hypothetical protein
MWGAKKSGGAGKLALAYQGFSGQSVGKTKGLFWSVGIPKPEGEKLLSVMGKQGNIDAEKMTGSKELQEQKCNLLWWPAAAIRSP